MFLTHSNLKIIFALYLKEKEQFVEAVYYLLETVFFLNITQI